MAWESESRVLASKLEFHIKTLTKQQKEKLIQEPSKLGEFLAQKVDRKMYQLCQYKIEKGVENGKGKTI